MQWAVMICLACFGRIAETWPMKKILLALFFVIFPACVLAGPFGTQMGAKPGQFSGLKDAPPDFGVNTYETRTIPKPHYSLNRYVLGFDSAGLERVVAFTDFENMDGRSAKALYNELETQLAEKYGTPGNYGTRENSGDYRYWYAVWEKDLPDDLAKIYLSIRVASAARLRVAIIYVYRNAPDAEEIKKRNKEAL